MLLATWIYQSNLVAETPTKQTPRTSISQDIIKCLGIVTVKQGRADTVTKKDFLEIWHHISC